MMRVHAMPQSDACVKQIIMTLDGKHKAADRWPSTGAAAKKESPPPSVCSKSSAVSLHDHPQQNPCGTHTKRVSGINVAPAPRLPNFPSGHATLELLECTVCCESMLPPIFQCKEGHTLCEACSKRVSQCPTCRSGCIDIRCRALEILAYTLEDVHCRFQSYGCRARFKYTELKEHESKCQYKPLGCPASKLCHYEGTGEELVEHLVNVHSYEQLSTNRVHCVCNKNNVTLTPGYSSDEDQYLWQNQVYSCFDKHFLLRIHRKIECDPQYYISIIGLHSRHHSNRYYIHVQGNHRKYSFEGPVWSLRKGFAEVERVRDCLILPENIAIFLSGGKGSENDLAVINLCVSGEIMPSS